MSLNATLAFKTATNLHPAVLKGKNYLTQYIKFTLPPFEKGGILKLTAVKRSVSK